MAKTTYEATITNLVRDIKEAQEDISKLQGAQVSREHALKRRLMADGLSDCLNINWTRLNKLPRKQ